jgi:broad specificity phosphatase PhoE
MTGTPSPYAGRYALWAADAEERACSKDPALRSWHRTKYLHRYEPCDGVYGWDELFARFQRIGSRNRRDEAYFFRHGATKYNEHNRVSGQHDTVLSELGRVQAAALRDALPRSIDLIVCSGLRRTYQTMELSVPEPVRRHTKMAIDPRLNEVNLGVLQGRRRAQLPQFERGDLDFAPEKGESYRVAARRVLSVIVDIFDGLAETGDSPRTALVFCHAGVLRIISTLVHGGPADDVFKTNPANGECVALPASGVRLPTYWNKAIDHYDAKECHSL